MTVTGMAEYIDRQEAIAAIMSEPSDAHYPHWYADKIKSIPAVDVATVRYGRWENITGGMITLGDCSECKVRQPVIGTNYCKNCGAKMDGGAD